jgi:phage FluMu gp28-like protein
MFCDLVVLTGRGGSTTKHQHFSGMICARVRRVMTRFYLGIDLGKTRDHTAIAIVERADTLLLRYAERVALGTPYPQVVEHIRRMVNHENLRGQCAAVVDGTGVGAPVVDLLRSGQLGCEVCAVNITGGERPTQSGNVWNVPKRDLMAGVQVLLEKRGLRIARRLKETGPLIRELTDVRLTAGSGGKLRMGADRAGQHDDLVIALALACWRAKRRENGFGTSRLPGI